MRTVDGDYDPQKLPPEWAHWLRKTRATPPTTQEVSRAAAARLSTRLKAAELAAEDARRRFQARVCRWSPLLWCQHPQWGIVLQRESLGLQSEPAPPEPRMDRFVDQLSSLKVCCAEWPPNFLRELVVTLLDCRILRAAKATHRAHLCPRMVHRWMHSPRPSPSSSNSHPEIQSPALSQRAGSLARRDAYTARHVMLRLLWASPTSVGSSYRCYLVC